MVEELVFLGSGGGRIVTALQLRATGGIILRLNGKQIHIDPGPGALVNSRGYGVDPTKTEIVCVTHQHIDHSNDVAAMIEAMAHLGTRKKGILVSNDKIWSDYHRGLVEQEYIMKAGDVQKIGDIEITAVKARHNSDPIGLIFRKEGVSIGYTSNTEYFEELSTMYNGINILIMDVLRPSGEGWVGHLSTDGAIKILRDMKTKPKLCIIQHFGLKMIKSNPVVEARRIATATGVEVIAAKDGMKIRVND